MITTPVVSRTEVTGCEDFTGEWQYYNRSCYMCKARDRRTWKDAEKRCKILEAELLEVNNEGENNFIWGKLPLKN